MLVEKVTRKSMTIRPSGRSTDFISPSFALLRLTEKGGNMDILDAVGIKESHDKKWTTYFKKNETLP